MEEPSISNFAELCVFCCYSFIREEGGQKEEENFSELDQLFEELRIFYSCNSRNVNSRDRFPSGKLSLLDLESLSVCPDCLSSVKSAMDKRQKAKKVEIRVSYLQEQVQAEVRKLWVYMEQFGEEIGKVEDAVRNSDENCLTYAVDDLELSRWRRSKQEIDWLRKGVMEVRADLQLYNSDLEKKFSPAGAPKHESKVCENKTKTVKRRKKTNCEKKPLPKYALELNKTSKLDLVETSKSPEYVSASATLEDPFGLSEYITGDDFLADVDNQHQQNNQAEPPVVYGDNFLYNEGSDVEDATEDADFNMGGNEAPDTSDTEIEDWSEEPKFKKAHSLGNHTSITATGRRYIKRQNVFFKALKLSKPEISRLIKKYNVDMSGMSKLKKEFVIRALGRMKARDEMPEKSNKETISSELVNEEGFPNIADPNPKYDDYWFRKKYIIEYKEGIGFSVGGIPFLINEDEGRLECSQCDYRAIFNSNAGRRDAGYKEKNIYHHILGYHLEVFRCLRCGQRFRGEWRYRDHLRAHAEPSIHTCDICLRPLSSYESLSYHKITHMNEEEKEEARNSAEWKSRFYKSRAMMPPSLERFPCTICNKEFKNKLDMKKHLKRHEERDQVVCPICGKSMLQFSYDVYHKIYSCPLDGQEVHRVPCSQCNQTFKSPKFLKRHIERTHSSAVILRPHICEICGKSFKTRENLRLHSLLHNDKIEFSCKTCGKGFAVRRYWRRHEPVCSGDRLPEQRRKQSKKHQLETFKNEPQSVAVHEMR